MKESIEFRLNEDHAEKYFPKSVGEDLGGVWKVITQVGSPLYDEIGQAYRELLPEYLFFGWVLRRKYTKKELAEAEVFLMTLEHQWQVYGEMCGTEYDSQDACRDCGGGLRRVGPLRMDLRKLPQKTHLVSSFSNEWTVTPEFIDLAERFGLSGLAFTPVSHVPYVMRDDIAMEELPSGRAILRLARERGINENDAVEYAFFANSPEYQALYKLAVEEHIALHGESSRVKAARTRAMRAKPPKPWFELSVTSKPVDIASKTYINEGPFDPCDENRCASHGGEFGHVIGSHIISELYIKRESWNGSDVTVTGQLFGKWYGSCKPGPEFLVSPRFRQWVLESRIRGCSFQRAHLV